MKNILNVIIDILTLMALCVAAIGHVLPWLDTNRMSRFQGVPLTDFQEWHVERSGIALAALAALIALSLIINWGPEMRRLLNLMMFGSAFAALLFQLMIFSNFQMVDEQRLHLRDTGVGFAMSMIPTCVAVFFCLLRMLWTMPPTRTPKVLPASLAARDQPPPKKVHPF